jgi:tRNA A-37 threonylcarbamoyl transferase component Bud32
LNFLRKNGSIGVNERLDKCALVVGDVVAFESGMVKEKDLPEGYRSVSRSGLNIVFKEGYAETFGEFSLPEGPPGGDGAPALRGRGTLASLPLAEDAGERALLRKCIRGGVFGRFLGGLYLNAGTPRPLSELKISQYARASGITTPEVLAAVFQGVGPFFYRGALAVREISPSADLEAELASLGHPAKGETLGRKRRTISSLGRLVAKMHEAGIWHADLHLKNILLAQEDDGPKLYLLDLDAARVMNPLSGFRRRLNILRLYRSVEKANRRGRVITRTDLLRFLRSYAEHSSRPLRESAVKLGRMLPLWRLKWKLSDALGV